MQAIARQVRATLRARRLGVSVIFTDLVPVAPIEGPIAALYLASTRAAVDPSVSSQTDALAEAGVAVVPVIRDGQSFAAPHVPSGLQRIGGLRWDAAGTEVADHVLAALGLREADRRVFISYGRRDADGMARQLWAALGGRGFEVFLDRFSLRPGQDWQSRLDAELGDKSFVVILESDAAAESPWVQHEAVYAIKNHLGVQVLTLPGSRADREIAAIPEPFRQRLTPDDLIGRGPGRRFRAPRLPMIVRLIEEAHDDGMRRRRNYLLMSSLDLVRKSGWTTTQLPDWSLVAERVPDQLEYLRIAPRPPRPVDLRQLDAARRTWAGASDPPIGRLIHEAADLDPLAADLMDWIAKDRDLALTQLQDVPAALL